MNKLIGNDFALSNNEKFERLWNENLLNAVNLTTDIAVIIDDINTILGKNLPACLYRLKLHNELSKHGFQLHEEESALNSGTKSQSVRKLIIVNNIVAVEYIVTDRVADWHTKRLRTDLQDNDCEIGLLINISGSCSVVELTTVHKTCILH